MLEGEVDPLKVVRNSRTLHAYRARSAAARRRGTPFLLLPIFLNPAMYVPALRVVLPHHLPAWTVMAFIIGWTALACASLGFGVHRIERYRREHPLTGELKGVGRLA